MKQVWKLIFVALVSVLVSSLNAASEERVALVIGNSKYTDATPLENPKNDADDMAASLERLGFRVVKGIDLDYQGMRKILKEFSSISEGAETSLFYYAGHAVQLNGENYIAPTDTVLERESDLPYETFTLNRIQSMLEKNSKTLLLFLDACRDNPLSRRFTRGTRSTGGTRGLARPPSTSEGTYIAFSTQPGNVALDGVGRNSPFTKALLNHIEKPGLEIASLMTEVRREVFEDTGQQQLPWSNSSLLGQFYFGDPVNPANSSENLEGDENLEKFALEREAWQKIAETNNVELIKKFINDFPNGSLVSVARYKLALLESVGNSTDLNRKPNSNETNASDTSLASLSTSDQLEGVENEPQITAKDIKNIQSALNRVGCNAGTADGLWGNKSRRALADFGKHADIKFASTDPELKLLDKLDSFQGRVCPLVCGARYEVSGDQCRLKVCPAGQKLSSKGKCYTPRKTTKATAQKTKKTTNNANCFVFNGKTVCE